MAETTFILNDKSTGGSTPVVEVRIVENDDGTLTFHIRQLVAAGNYLGDLRGFFFDIADETLLGSLTMTDQKMVLADGTLVSSGTMYTGNDSLSSAGSASNNMNGMLGSDGGFDVGISIGTEGVGANGDDVRGFDFTLNATGGLSLEDFINVNFGVRITSVGMTTDGDAEIETSRTGSVKMIETSATVAEADAYTVNEDNVLTISAAAGVLANDNSGGGTLTAILVDGPDHGTLTLNANGSFVYTPDPNFNGIDTFTYKAVVNGESSIQTVTITVNPVNDAPVAAADSATTNEDQAVIINVLGNDSDVDGDTLSVSAVTQGAHGSVSINPNGTVTYTPNANFNGTDSFTYTVSDGHGGFDTETVNVTINPVNDAPVAAADGATTDEDTPVQINVLGNDSDVDGDALSVSAVTQGAHGTVTNNGDGTVTYTPNLNFNGTDSFTYTVSDGHGGFDTETVTVTVTPVNDAPVAAADSATTDEDSPVQINVLGNDSDVDGDTLSVSAVTQGANGSVSINPNGTVTYTPNANFNGTDSFTYTVSDGHGGTDTETVTVTVTPVNDAPVASDDSASGAEDTIISGSVAGNDSDPEGDSLSYTVNGTAPAGFSMLANGSWTLDANNAAYQALNAGQFVDVQVGYTVSDGHGGTDTATLTVRVNGANDGTTITGLHFDPNEQAGNSLSLGKFVVEGASGPVTYDATVAAVGGATGAASIDVDAAGVLQIGGTPTGQYTLTVLVKDAGGNVIDDFSYNLWLGGNTAENFTFTLGSTDNIGAGQGQADTIIGSDGADFLFGGSQNDRLIGNGGNDWMSGGGGNDDFLLRAPAANGTDLVVDFAQGDDQVMLMQGGGGWNAAGSSPTSSAIPATAAANAANLAAADYVNRTNVANISASDTNKVVELQTAQTTSQIQSGLGGAANAYVVVFNSTTNRAELWYDDNWSDAGNRKQVMTFDSTDFDTLSETVQLTNANFGEWQLV